MLLLTKKSFFFILCSKIIFLLSYFSYFFGVGTNTPGTYLGNSSKPGTSKESSNTDEMCQDEGTYIKLFQRKILEKIVLDKP